MISFSSGNPCCYMACDGIRFTCMECRLPFSLSNINGPLTLHEKSFLCSWFVFTCDHNKYLFNFPFFYRLYCNHGYCRYTLSKYSEWQWCFCCFRFTWFTFFSNSTYAENGSSWWNLEIIGFCCLCS